MLIPPDALDPDTLRAVCEEFVSRDGTQTGDLREAGEKVMRLLRQGKAVLSFDEEDGCQVWMKKDWEKAHAEGRL